MNYFFYRLLPPRSTFLTDMTPEERAAMQAHGQYWAGLMKEGTAVAFGPVIGPQGPFGVAIVEVEPGRDVNALGANDPVIQAGLGFSFEMLPMVTAVVRPKA